MKIFVFLLPLFIGSVLSWGGYQINLEQRELDFDENVLNVDMQIKRRDDRTILNAKFEIYDDIDEPIYGHFSVYEKDSNGEFLHLVNSSVNVCNILTRVKAHPLLKVIIKELMRNSNIPTTCPFKKGVYSIRDFVLNHDFLPPFIPTGTFMIITRYSRLIDGDDVTHLKGKYIIDIDYAKERKSMKFF